MDTTARTTHVTPSGPDTDHASSTAATARLTGATVIAGAVIMVVGAALYFSAGSAADLPSALADGTMPAYLDAVAGSAAIVANLTLWIAGATLMGSAGVGLALLARGRPAVAGLGAASGLLGAATAIGAFVAWLAVVVVVAPTGEALLGQTVAWFAWHMDTYATVLIVGFGPLLHGLAGRAGWAPTWLVVWAVLAGIAGALSLVAAYVPTLAGASFPVVPIGLGWMIASGIVLLRHTGRHPAAAPTLA